MTFDYKSSNFLSTSTTNDKRIRIYDKNLNFKFNIKPEMSHFYIRNNCIIIKIINDNDITLSFETKSDAIIAIGKLSIVKNTPSGTSGTDGTSGTSGTDGSSGTSGTDGTSGTSGTSGTNGTSGTDGISPTGVLLSDGSVQMDSLVPTVIGDYYNIGTSNSSYLITFDNTGTTGDLTAIFTSGTFIVVKYMSSVIAGYATVSSSSLQGDKTKVNFNPDLEVGIGYGTFAQVDALPSEYTPTEDFDISTKKYTDDFDVSGLVPYTGATGNVYLGVNDIIAKAIQSTLLSGSLTNPPTKSELESLIGTVATLGSGYEVNVWDSSNSIMYNINTNGTDWFYVVKTKSL